MCATARARGRALAAPRMSTAHAPQASDARGPRTGKSSVGELRTYEYDEKCRSAILSEYKNRIWFVFGKFIHDLAQWIEALT